MYRLEMIYYEMIMSNNFQINLEVYPLPDLDRYEPETWEYTMAMSMLETYTKPSVWLWNKANSIKYYKLFIRLFKILGLYLFYNIFTRKPW